MISKFLKTFLSLVLLTWAASAFGQPVQVSVALAPPYPVHLEDYAQMRGQMIVTLVNTSPTFLQLRLVPSIKGPNGISATLKPGYRPSAPISLAPMETRVFTGAQLQSLNAGISLQNMDIQGVSVQEIIRTETLPEGLYDLCVSAFDFSSNTQLSPEGAGCTPFNVTWYDPPVVVLPADGAHAQVLNPQFVNIGWTPSGVGGLTRYRLMLMDMTANGLANPNDAFDMGFPPFFQKENLITLGHPLGMAEPPLTPGHLYAVRVQAYDPQGNIKFKNEGKSQVTTFTYGGGSGIGGPGGIVNNGNNNGPNYQFNCLGDAAAQQPADQVLATGIPANAEFKIGHFTVKNVQMQFSGSGYTGTGAIKIDFIKTVVKVEFTDIKLNVKKEAFGDSKITATVDAQGLYDASLSNLESGTIDLPSAQLKQIEQKVKEAGRLISKMDGATEKGLPLGFDNAKGNVAVVGIIFKPTGAFVNALFAAEIPESINGDYLCLAQKGIELQPGGFGIAGATLTLANDVTISLSTYASLKFLKGADTYLSMDCTGFKELSVAGKLEFSRERALPLDAQGNVIADINTKLSAGFKVKGAAGLSKFIAQTTLSHDFAVPQANNLVFKRPNNGNQSPDLVFDFSDTENAPGFAQGFPALTNNWKGVYLKGLTVVLPEPFKKGAQKVSINVSNLLIDKQGISATFELNAEILKTSDGNLGGLGLGINYLKIKIEGSQLTEGSIKGKVTTPISSTAIGYECTVSAGENGAEVSFGINEIPALNIDMWVASAAIEEASSITVTKQQNNKWGAEIDLTGVLSINLKGNEPENGGVKKFNLPGLAFEHLKVNTIDGGTPSFQMGVLEFDNLNLPQIKLGAFELNLDSISLRSLPGNKYGLGFPLSLCLLGQDNDGGGQQQENGNTIMGNTDLMIVGVYDANKKRFVYDHIEAKRIEVNASIGPLLEMNGSLQIYSDDDDYGDGFRGELHAKAEGIKIQIDFIAQFGKKGATKYCFIDAMAKFPAIVIPGTALAINGFGGGFWYNMSQQTEPAPRPAGQFTDKMTGDAEVGKSNSGVNYVVNAGKLGFKACVAFCSAGTDEVFNGDVTFAMQLDIVDISLDWLKLSGKAYLMQGINDRSSSSAVSMTADIEIVPEEKLFQGNFAVVISVMNGKIQGSGDIDVHFKGQGDGQVEWWIKVGQWSEEKSQEPWEDDSRVNIGIHYQLGNMLNVQIKFFAYFMVGNNLPGLPPIPDMIYANLPALKKAETGAQQKQVDPAVTSGKGINIGAGIFAGIDLNVLFFYARCTTLIGFDILFQKTGGTCGSQGEDYGINGWYAKGQAYAYLQGEAGLQLDVWFCKKCQLKLLEVQVGSILQAELPNPIYMKGDFAIHGEVLNGLIEVDADLHFEMGEKCLPSNGYFGDYPMISSLKPDVTKDVDLFTDPSVSFNFVRNKIYTLVEGDDHEVMMAVNDSDIKFEQKSGNSWKPVPGKLIWSGSGKAAKFVPDQMLENNTTYRFLVKATGKEWDNGKQIGNAVVEDTSYVFKTTPTAPDKIPWKEVVSTYPYPRQRFHASNLTGKGYVKMSKEPLPNMLHEIFQKPAPAGMVRRVVARVTDLAANQQFETPLEYVNGLFLFDIPYDKMKPNTIYRIDLLRIFAPLDPAGGQLAAAGPGVQSYQQMVDKLTLQKTKLEGNSTSKKKQEHKIIGGLYFRTSKYSSMYNKMTAIKVKKTGSVKRLFDVENGIFGSEECPVVLISCDEGFDGYDLKGYNLNGQDGFEDENLVEPPMFTFNVTDPGQWLADQRKTFWTMSDQVIDNGKINMTSIKTKEEWHLDRWTLQPQIPGFMSDFRFPTSANVPGAIYNTVLKNDRKLNFFGTPANAFNLGFLGATWGKDVEDELRQDGTLAGNEGFMKPAPPLSNAEINAAKAQGQQAEDDDNDLNIFNFTGNQGGGPGKLQPQLGLAGIAADKQYFAVVDYRAWLANADWEFIKFMYMNFAVEKWENSHPDKITKVRDFLNGRGRPGKMPKGDYQMSVRLMDTESKTLNYKVN